MLNRGQAHRAQPAESVQPEICASKWHNIVRHLRRRMIVRFPLPAGCAIATPAVMHGLPSPMAHPRGGRAIRPNNIASHLPQTALRAHNRASGCNFYNPLLTASVAMPATCGPVKHPINYNRGAVPDSAIKAIRIL